MQLASHELNELSQLVAGCYNTVTCLTDSINQANAIQTLAPIYQPVQQPAKV